MESKAKKVNKLQKRYSLNNHNGQTVDEKNFIQIKGTIPILLSAPHAVNQKRNGKIKSSDYKTGAIVEYLCRTTGSYGIVRVANNNDDPQRDTKGTGLKYKEAIIDIIKENNIKAFIDVHGADDSHGWSFCLGTNCGKNLNGNEKIVDIFVDTLRQIQCEGIQKSMVSIDAKNFKASKDGNVSLYVAKNAPRIPCVQLEIAYQYRSQIKKLEKLVDAMENIIKQISKMS